MKKYSIVFLFAFLFTLCGCSAQPVFETLGNILGEPENILARQIHIQLPEDAAITTIVGESKRMYLCGDYEIMLETVEAGDLNQTLTSLTGFEADSLTVIQTEHDDMTRYECVWTSAGEGGEQVNRTVILDDGYYHYCIIFCAPAAEAGALQSQWQSIVNTLEVE